MILKIISKHWIFKRDKYKSWSQIYAILVVSINHLLLGALFAWTSPTILFLLDPKWNPNPVTVRELFFPVIIPFVPMVLVCPLVAKISDKIGRKKTLLLVTIPVIVSLILIITGGHFYVYYVSRVTFGTANGCGYLATPPYIAEISTRNVRGRWGNALPVFFYLGQLVMNVIGAYFSIRNAGLILMLFPVIFILNYYFLPESPYWLLMKERKEEARMALQWLRRSADVEDELKQMVLDVKRQQSQTGRYKDLWVIASNRKSVLIVSAIWWMQIFSGFVVITAFIKPIFKMSGNNMDAATSSIIVCAACFIFTLVASYAWDKLDRRVAAITSCMFCSLLLFAQGTVFYVNDELHLNWPMLSILPLVLMIIYIMAYGIGMGIVPMLLLGELFSYSLRGKAVVVAVFNMGVASGIASIILTQLMQIIGLYAVFLFFACCTLISTFVCYFIVPETRGKTLEQIHQSL